MELKRGLIGDFLQQKNHSYPNGVYLSAADLFGINLQASGRCSTTELLPFIAPPLEMARHIGGQVRGSTLSRVATFLQGKPSKDAWLIDAIPRMIRKNVQLAQQEMIAAVSLVSKLPSADIDLLLPIEGSQIPEFGVQLIAKSMTAFGLYPEEMFISGRFPDFKARLMTCSPIFVRPDDNLHYFPAVNSNGASELRAARVQISSGTWIYDNIQNIEYSVHGVSGLLSTDNIQLASVSLSPTRDKLDLIQQQQDTRGSNCVNNWDCLRVPIVDRVPNSDNFRKFNLNGSERSIRMNNSGVIQPTWPGKWIDNQYVAHGAGVGTTLMITEQEWRQPFEFFRRILFGPSKSNVHLKDSFFYFSPEVIETLSSPIRFGSDAEYQRTELKLIEFLRVIRKAILYGDLVDEPGTHRVIASLADPATINGIQDARLKAKQHPETSGWIRVSQTELLVSLFYGPKEMINLAEPAQLENYFQYWPYITAVKNELSSRHIRNNHADSKRIDLLSREVNGWIDICEAVRLRFPGEFDQFSNLELIIHLTTPII